MQSRNPIRSFLQAAVARCRELLKGVYWEWADPFGQRQKPRRVRKCKGPREKDIFGRQGENLAVRYLKTKGYRILARNLKFSIGEIDIIAQKDECIVFFEVKTRRTDAAGLPWEVITEPKKRRIMSMAEEYIRKKRLWDRDVRFDVLSIVWPLGEQPVVGHYEDAFNASET